MTIQRSWGPLVVVGQNPALGSPTGITGVAGPPPYVSGVGENPDAGPSVFFGGMLFRDQRIMSRPDGATLTAGGYDNQDFGFVSHTLITVDMAPAASAANNIVAAAAPAANTPMTLAGASTGIAVVAAPGFTVPGFLNVIPTGCLRIDANPSYVGYGTATAILGWGATATGRGIVLTSSASLSGINFTIRGYDLYGFPQTEVIAGPASATTVNSRKCWKWIRSITPSGASASTAAFGTIAVFEFPILARRTYQTFITWNNNTIGAQGGSAFVLGTAGNPLSTTADTWQPPDTTSPATTTTGTPRGAYTSHDAPDGTKRLSVEQTILPADLCTLASVFGVPPV